MSTCKHCGSPLTQPEHPTVTVVSRHPGFARAVFDAAVTDPVGDVVAQVREAYEFYQLDSDKAMAAQIFVQQVGQILETDNGETPC